MQKFTFNMQKILNLRRFEEKQAQVELGKAVSNETQIKNAIDLIARQNVQTVQNASGIKNPSELFNLNNYLRLLSQRKEKLLQDLAKAHIETEQKREKMREAMMKVKALEKLREVRQIEWAQENRRREEKELDEISNSKQLRQG